MRKLSLAAAVLAASTLTMTGCSLFDSGNEPMSQENLDKIKRYSQCMKQYGIDVPVPDPNEPAPEGVKTFDPNDLKTRAAEAACAKFSPPSHKEGKLSAAQEDWALKTAECLRKQGIQAKDPAPGTVDVNLDPNATYSQEKLMTAFRACNKPFPD